MIILPFIYEENITNQLKIQKVTILCQGGTILWEEADDLDIDVDIIHSNDLKSSGTKIINYNFQEDHDNKRVALIHIDKEKTNLSDMFNCEELEITYGSDILCWRTFYIVFTENGTPWINIPNNEVLGKYSIGSIIHLITSSLHQL